MMVRVLELVGDFFSDMRVVETVEISSMRELADVMRRIASAPEWREYRVYFSSDYSDDGDIVLEYISEYGE